MNNATIIMDLIYLYHNDAIFKYEYGELDTLLIHIYSDIDFYDFINDLLNLYKEHNIESIKAINKTITFKNNIVIYVHSYNDIIKTI